jgi:hypothetical protein
MKNLIAFLLVLIVASNYLTAQSYGLGNADPSLFTKYKIPDTDLHSLWFNTNLSFNTIKNTYSNSDQTSSSTDENVLYSLSPRYYLLNQTDDRTLSLNFYIGGSYNYQREIYEAPSYAGQKEKNIDAYLNLGLSFNYNKYAGNSYLFYTIGTNISAYIDDQKKEDPVNISYNTYNSDKNQSYTISAGLGWGRMRNVTPVVEAIRLQERLKQVNAINSDLNEITIENLAQKFSQTSYYSNVHDRYSKYFWQDIEKILSDDRVSLSGLNQYSDSYIKEVLSEVRFVRNEGLESSFNFQINYQNMYQYQKRNLQVFAYDTNYYLQNNYGPFIDEELYLFLNGSVSYSHQLNLNSQLNFNLSLSGGPNLIRNGDKYDLPQNKNIKQEYSFTFGTGYNYELTDRLIATVNNNFSLSFQNSDIQGKVLSNNLSFMLRYFVEDNLSLTAGYQWNYTDTKSPNYVWENNYNNHYVSIGFTYYIDRGLIFN